MVIYVTETALSRAQRSPLNSLSPFVPIQRSSEVASVPRVLRTLLYSRAGYEANEVESKLNHLSFAAS